MKIDRSKRILKGLMLQNLRVGIRLFEGDRPLCDRPFLGLDQCPYLNSAKAAIRVEVLPG